MDAKCDSCVYFGRRTASFCCKYFRGFYIPLGKCQHLKAHKRVWGSGLLAKCSLWSSLDHHVSVSTSSCMSAKLHSISQGRFWLTFENLRPIRDRPGNKKPPPKWNLASSLQSENHFLRRCFVPLGEMKLLGWIHLTTESS